MYIGIGKDRKIELLMYRHFAVLEGLPTYIPTLEVKGLNTFNSYNRKMCLHRDKNGKDGVLRQIYLFNVRVSNI